MIRVLVVDDSATMRSLIAATLHRDREIQVVGHAASSAEAREAIKALNPDVITLDIQMPAMNGLEFLEKIMLLRPMPVVMVSALTNQGAEPTLQALELGAFDCVAKPSTSEPAAFDRLIPTVRAAAHAQVRCRADHGAWSNARPDCIVAPGYKPDGRIVAIGASTGGVEALLAILSRFPANCPPTVITQHMPATFTRSFAQRLNRVSQAEISEAFDGALLEVGKVYLAPGGSTHLLISGSGTWRCRLRHGEPISGHRPSVDALFSSVAHAAGARAVGLILTGMGRDGARGMLAMRQAGAQTLGQDEASCVVYGMPKVAFELQAVGKQVRLDSIAHEILTVTNACAERDA